MMCFTTIANYSSARGTFAYLIISNFVIVIWYVYLWFDVSRRKTWFGQKDISITDVLILAMIHFLGFDLYGLQFLSTVTHI